MRRSITVSCAALFFACCITFQASGQPVDRIPAEIDANRTVVLAMGNPYVIGDFPAIQNYVCAFSNATVSETAVVKALFGEIPITGHLPVTIPGIASRGEGLERPVRRASGGSNRAQP